MEFMIFLALLGLTILLGGYMFRVGKPMVDSPARKGILALELAPSFEEVLRLLELWGPKGVAAARRSISLDFYWIFCYVATIAYPCLLAADRLSQLGARPGLAAVVKVAAVLASLGAAGLQLVAGLLDWVENRAMLRLLTQPVEADWRLTRRCATWKFGLVLGGVTWVLLVGIWFIAMGA